MTRVAPCRWCGDPVYADGYPHHSVQCLWRLCEVTLGGEAFERAREAGDVVGAMRALAADAAAWRDRDRVEAAFVASLRAKWSAQGEAAPHPDDVPGGGRGKGER